MNLVYGAGFYDSESYKSNGGSSAKEFSRWRTMLQRCYSEKFHIKNPSYIGCTASENFLNYSYFYDWCQKQHGWSENWDLDKDLLIQGNKEYSEKSCIFLPREININIQKKSIESNGLPYGVKVHTWSGRYFTSIRIDGDMKYLGTFDCPIEAFKVYKEEKEKNIHRLANKHKKLLDPRAYNALMSHVVDMY